MAVFCVPSHIRFFFVLFYYFRVISIWIDSMDERREKCMRALLCSLARPVTPSFFCCFVCCWAALMKHFVMESIVYAYNSAGVFFILSHFTFYDFFSFGNPEVK